jgi:hypothetical protein
MRFNHAAHIKEDGVLAVSGAREVLACASCHRPDSEHRFMQPIRYEMHCSRCHTNALVFDTDRFGEQPAPHGDAEIVRAVVRNRYAEFVRQQPRSLSDASQPGSDRRVAGRPGSQLTTKAEWDWVQQKAEAAQRVLFGAAGGCRFCHEVSRNDSGWSVARPDIPDRWLPAARFHHGTHRTIECTTCHAAESSTETPDVLLPSIDSCRSCHGPAKGARHDCTECHAYHGASMIRGAVE